MFTATLSLLGSRKVKFVDPVYNMIFSRISPPKYIVQKITVMKSDRITFL